MSFSGRSPPYTPSPYQSNQASASPTPPPPPPKPATSQSANRDGTTMRNEAPRRPPPPIALHDSASLSRQDGTAARSPLAEQLRSSTFPLHAAATSIPGQGLEGQYIQEEDPGPTWLPPSLKDKTRVDLKYALETPSIINALSQARTFLPEEHERAVNVPLETALAVNIGLAEHVNALESSLMQARETAQGQLLALLAAERRWREKQAAMDAALAPFSPATLYQRLTLAVQEQENLSQALEETFLEGDTEGGKIGDREAADFVRRYRETRKVACLRREAKSRWDEGRVGGWR